MPAELHKHIRAHWIEVYHGCISSIDFRLVHLIAKSDLYMHVQGKQP